MERYEEDKEKMETKIDDKISIRIFIWALSFVFLVLAIVSTYAMGASNKAETNSTRVSNIEGDIKAINVGIGSINENLKDIKDSIRKQ